MLKTTIEQAFNFSKYTYIATQIFMIFLYKI